MKCPYCGYQESKVVDSRHSEDGLSIRRRRECLSCQKRFTTYETVECLPIVVIKRGGIRQAFDRNKILNGMLRACEKRPVPMQMLENATDEIEQSIQNSLDAEKPNKAVAVMATLMAVTFPVPSQSVSLSLCRLETTVPKAMIIEMMPA